MATSNSEKTVNPYFYKQALMEQDHEIVQISTYPLSHGTRMTDQSEESLTTMSTFLRVT